MVDAKRKSGRRDTLALVLADELAGFLEIDVGGEVPRGHERVDHRLERHGHLRRLQ